MRKVFISMKILVNGTFDIVHRGHLNLLNYARSLGHTLTVAIDSDKRVKLLKGADRPINNMYERAYLLSNLKSVNQVLVFDSDEELRNIVARFDIMVKGTDYIGKDIIGSDLIDIKFYRVTDGYSSTQTIQNIINR